MTRCLLVTRLPAFGAMAKDAIRRLGIEVAVAADRKDALGKFTADIPDVVFIAENDEPTQTIDTIRQLRAEDGGNAPKIVVMVRYDNLASRPDILHAGADECGAGFSDVEIGRVFERLGLLRS